VKLTIPERALVLLVGVSGSGKSTFAKQHFRASQIISSDCCRSMIADDENDQSATSDAFEVLRFILRKRMMRGLMTVIDATNVQSEARKPLLALAGEYNVPAVAIVLNLGEDTCHERAQVRLHRKIDPQVIVNQLADLRRSLPNLESEGLCQVFMLDSPEAVKSVEISVPVSPISL
jgi:protein phosphatase